MITKMKLRELFTVFATFHEAGNPLYVELSQKDGRRFIDPTLFVELLATIALSCKH